MRDHLRDALIGGGTVFVLLFGLALIMFVLRGCQRAPVSIGIDAGPGERAIAAELDAAVQREHERIEQLIASQQATLAALGERDRAGFDAAKRRGRVALAEWFASRMPDGGR